MHGTDIPIGDAIRKARKAAGLSQEELAFRSRLSRNYVSLLELEVKSPTVQVLSRICQALDVKVSKLVERAERAMEK